MLQTPPINVYLNAVDPDGRLTYESRIEVDPLKLMILAESNEHVFLSKGRQFAEGAIPFWAAEAFKQALQGSSHDELHRITLNVAMSAWLVAKAFEGLKPEEFVRSNLHFTLLPSGAVKFSRITKQVAA